MKKKWFIIVIGLVCVIDIMLLLSSSVLADSSVIDQIDPAPSYNYEVVVDRLTFPVTWMILPENAEEGLSYTFFYDDQEVGAGSRIPANTLVISYAGYAAGTGYQIHQWYIEGHVVCNGKSIYHFETENGDLTLAESSCSFDLSGTIANFAVPDGYHFSDDQYAFENWNEPVDKNYYTETFGTVKGEALYADLLTSGIDGHGFGMAASTVAALKDSPAVTDYVSAAMVPCPQLSAVRKGTANSFLAMTAKEYINLCNVYQQSYEIQEQRTDPAHQGVRNVYNAVKAAISSAGTTGIAIDLWGGPGGHTVYAYGTDGDDILVDDSNASAQTRIRVDGNSWTYSCGAYTWSSAAGCTVDYVDVSTVPYQRIAASVRPDVTLAEGSVIPGYTEETEADGSFALWNYPIADKMDAGRNLVILPDGVFDVAEAAALHKILATGGDAGSGSHAYWLEDGVASVEAQNKTGAASVIQLAGDELSVSVSVPANATAALSTDGSDTVVLTCAAGDPVAITVSTASVNGGLVDLMITGTAKNGHVDVSVQGDQIYLHGVTEGNVSYLADGERIKEKAFTKSDANVEITYDHTGATDTLIVSCDEAVPPEPEEETCKYCGEVHPDTAIGRLTKFLHNILYFFAHLFGIK